MNVISSGINVKAKSVSDMTSNSQAVAIGTEKDSIENRTELLAGVTANYEETRKDCQHEENSIDRTPLPPTTRKEEQQSKNSTRDNSIKEPIFEARSKDYGTSITEVRDINIYIYIVCINRLM